MILETEILSLREMNQVDSRIKHYRGVDMSHYRYIPARNDREQERNG